MSITPNTPRIDTIQSQAYEKNFLLNSNNIDGTINDGTTSDWSFSGDIELASKPTFVP